MGKFCKENKTPIFHKSNLSRLTLVLVIITIGVLISNRLSDNYKRGSSNLTSNKRILQDEKQPINKNSNFAKFCYYFQMVAKIFHFLVLKLALPQYGLAASLDFHWALSTPSYLHALSLPEAPLSHYFLNQVAQNSFFGFVKASIFVEDPENNQTCNQRFLRDNPSLNCGILQNYGTNLIVIGGLAILTLVISVYRAFKRIKKKYRFGRHPLETTTFIGRVLIRLQEFYGSRFFIVFMDGASFEIFIYLTIHMRQYYFSKLMNVGIAICLVLILYYVCAVVGLLRKLLYFLRDLEKLEALRKSLKPSASRFGSADVLFMNLKLKMTGSLLFPYLRLLRALIISFFISMIAEQPASQVISILVTEVLFLIYLVYIQPRQDTRSNLAELILQALIIALLAIKLSLLYNPGLPRDNKIADHFMTVVAISYLGFSLVIGLSRFFFSIVATSNFNPINGVSLKHQLEERQVRNFIMETLGNKLKLEPTMAWARKIEPEEPLQFPTRSATMQINLSPKEESRQVRTKSEGGCPFTLKSSPKMPVVSQEDVVVEVPPALDISSLFQAITRRDEARP